MKTQLKIKEKEVVGFKIHKRKCGKQVVGHKTNNGKTNNGKKDNYNLLFGFPGHRLR